MVWVDLGIVMSIFSTILCFADGHIFRVGRRVCPQRKVRYEVVPIKQTYTRPFYTRNCRVTNSCNSTHVIYKTAVRTVFYKRLVHNIVQKCCPGWQMKSPRDSGCMTPVCEDNCENGGACNGPNICRCPKEFTGSHCNIDVDECKTDNHNCSQICVNTHGSYRCNCYDGFQLSNKTHCEFCPLCLPAMEQMMNKVNDLQVRISSVEREKEEMMGNFSVLEHHYHEAMTKVDQLREATVGTRYFTPPTTTTTTAKTTPKIAGDSPYKFDRVDRIASLSEQISLLEERLAECQCFGSGYESSRVGRRRKFYPRF